MDKIHKFINILFHILQSQEYECCIKWTDSGKAFIVPKRKQFCETVMEQHFKTKKIQSFFRQLNQYGFKMIKNKQNLKEYSHNYFIKDNYHNLSKITRKLNSNQNQDDESLRISSLVKLNEQLKQQLDRLKLDQQRLAKQLRINCSIQSIIMNSINQVIQQLSHSVDERLVHKYQRPFLIYFELIKGYQPEISLQLLELMQEEYFRESPLSIIQNSPLAFPFF